MIQPQDWNEIFEEQETNLEVRKRVASMRNGGEDVVRFYEGDTYFKVGEGWVELGEIVDGINEVLDEPEEPRYGFQG